MFDDSVESVPPFFLCDFPLADFDIKKDQMKKITAMLISILWPERKDFSLGAYATPFSISLSGVHDRMKGEGYTLRRRIAAQGAD